MKYFFTALQVMGIVSNWSAAAMADGRITADEAGALVKQLAAALGLPLGFDVDTVFADRPHIPAPPPRRAPEL